MHAKRFDVCIAALVAVSAALPAAHAWFDDTSRTVVAVNARTSPDYHRERGPDGHYRPETYTFAEGGFLGSPDRDPSISDLKFSDVARALTGPLAAQGYRPGFRPNDLDMILVVFWGTTQGTRNDPSLRHSVPTAGDLREVTNQPSDGYLTHFGDARNAELLGNEGAFAQYARLEWQPLRALYEAPIKDELELNRYFVVLKAFDFKTARRQHHAKLLWDARYSIDEVSNDFSADLAAITKQASVYFGRDSGGLRHRDVAVGSVSVGTPHPVQ